MRLRIRRTWLGLFGLVAAATAAPAAALTYVGSVVADGLNNPRGLAFAPDGALYVAEAGFLSQSGPTVDIRGTTWRYGETGSITRLFGGAQQRVVTGLPSLAAVATGETTGAQDVAFGPDGTGYLVIGLGADPAVRGGALGSAPGALQLGTVQTFTGSGLVRLADVSAVEAASNPGGGARDSNPFHLAVAPGGVLVTDAGGNYLANATAGGASLVAVFPARNIGPPPPVSDSVPTGVAIGPDGAYYVGELTGFPFTQGAAQVYRLPSGGGAPTVFQGGFTNITDIAFGADGSLYVLELDADGLAGPAVGGRLVRVGTDGARETIFTQGLITPTGLTIGPDGAFYVTNFSAATGRGQVLRIAAVPEPATWAMLIMGFGAIGAALRRRRAAAGRTTGVRPHGPYALVQNRTPNPSRAWWRRASSP